MEAIVGRLQTPADDSGVRNDIHLVNTDNEVIVDYDNAGKARTLKVKMQETRPVVSRLQPSKDDYKSSYFWAQIVDATPSMATIEANLASNPCDGVNTSID